VVALRAGAVPEVVGDGGVVTDDLAGALRDLLEDPDRRAALSRRALARAARFTWAATAEGYVAAYRDALA
jgi:glycosyltransferase involved in cell wall biosynthesis